MKKNNKKITVLGAGTAGCFSALRYSLQSNEVELIHDPGIPSTNVGVATVPKVTSFVWDWLKDISWYDNNPLDAVPKLGILYEGWGNTEKNFHAFPFGSLAMHFRPAKLQEYILNIGAFKVIEDTISTYDSIDSDIIIDCSGTPIDWDDYDGLLNPLNAVLLSETDEQDSNQLWTRSVATPNGWTFVIPIGSSTSYGYLYNDTITSDDDAISNFKEMFNVDEIRKMNFSNYIAKNSIIEDRIVLNGNKLAFIEPMEATSIAFYLSSCQYVWESIVLNQYSSYDANQFIRQKIEQIQNFILCFYQAGSKYETPFWDYAKSLKFDDPKFALVLEEIETPEWESTISKRIPNWRQSEGLYGQWPPYSIKWWYDRIRNA